MQTKTKTKLTDDQLGFLKEAFEREVERTEQVYLRGMEEGYYDWGEWRQTAGKMIRAIMRIYHIFGEEREVLYWKEKWRDIYEDEHRKWTEKDDEDLEKYLN